MPNKKPLKGEIEAIVNQWQDSTNETEKRRLAGLVIEKVSGFCWKLAIYYSRHNPSYKEDLVQEARLGTLQAMKSWDREIAAAKNNNFLTYATWWMRAYLTKYTTNHTTGPVRVNVNKYFEARRAKAESERDHTDLSLEHQQVLTRFTSLSSQRGLSEDNSWDNYVNRMLSLHGYVRENDGPVSIDAAAVFRQAETSLSTRDFEILLQYLNDEPLSVIARKYKLSRERARQIKEEVLETLRFANK